MDDYSGQKVLIVGGLGFIGSNLTIRLVQSGCAVTLVDNLHPSCGGNRFNIDPVKDDVEVVDGDCCDLDLMQRLVRGRSHVFNLAGHVSHIESMQYPFSDLRMNAIAPLTVLEACKRENRDARVVYAGTRQIYGRAESLPVTETHPLAPADVNGVNKMAGEFYHMVYHQACGLPATSLRLVNTYGPRQLVRHDRQGFIGWFVRLAIDGREIQLFGNGQQLRSFSFIDDVVDALMRAGAAGAVTGDYFNLGGIQPYTLEAVVRILLEITGKGSYRIVPFPQDKKVIDIGSTYTCWDKFHNATGWTPRVSIEDGLERMVAYYTRNKAHYW